MKIKRILNRILPVSFLQMEDMVSKLQNKDEENHQKVIQCLKEVNENIAHISSKLTELQEEAKEFLSLNAQNNNKEIALLDKILESNMQNNKDLLLLNEITDLNSHNSKELIVLKEIIGELSQKIGNLQECLLAEINYEELEREICFIKDNLKKDNKALTDLQKENLWSAIFNNTIKDSTWLLNQSFSPGRWAMGYPALYLLYRVLEQFTPRSILELGLGQSTKMITQYVEHGDESIQHFVVEHDKTWIDFFKKTNKVASNTQIICLEREFIPYKDTEEVRVFKNFKTTFEAYSFDFIVVDAPLGGDMKRYSRIDILSLLPNNLCEQFVLILDDVNRLPEQNTMNEISSQLDQANIKYVKKVYGGEKETCIWTTPQWSFLCSL